jgi:hypothetical protein
MGVGQLCREFPGFELLFRRGIVRRENTDKDGSPTVVRNEFCAAAVIGIQLP